MNFSAPNWSKWLIVCALIGAVGGCSMAPAPPLASRSGARRGGSLFGQSASDPLLATDNNDPRAGSTLAISSSGPSASATEPRALNDVMAQLRSVGTTDPAVQARLMEDMQRTDPSLWPLLMQTYRSSLAYQNQKPNRTPTAVSNGSLTGAGTSTSAALPAEIRDARTAVAQAAQPVPPMNNPSPATALATPAATPSDQVVLVSSSPTPPQPQPPAAPPPQTAAASVTVTSPQTQPMPSTTVEVAKAPTPNPVPTSPPAPSPAEPAALPATTATPIAQAAAPAAPAQNAAVQQATFTTPAAAGGASADTSSVIAALEKQSQAPVQSPADISRQVSLRMLYLAAGRRDDALRPIDGLTAPEQEYWNKQLASAAALLDTTSEPDAAARATLATQHLNEAASRLAQLSPLAVRNISFCTEITSYGVVTPFKETEYTPGQQVLLYAEVENFKIEQLPKGYRTSLKGSYQVVDKQGVKMAGTDPQTMEEVCQNPRRDYFVRYRLNLPKPLPDGAYTLQLTVEDTLSQKTAKASLDFTIKNK